MDKKDKLLRRIYKTKKLIRTNKSQYIIIPNTWINLLGWNKKELIMAINPINEEIIIRAEEVLEYGKEVDNVDA